MSSKEEPWKNRYGLIIPKQEKVALAINARRAKIQAFKASSSSDDDEGAKATGPVSKYGSTTQKRAVKKQEEREAARALEQDSTIFQYDEVYEDIQAQKIGTIPEEARKADKERKPKYIENLLKAASKRKRDYESRVEKQQQKEREKEGDEFADKEVFVTAAYRKKMEEIAQFEEEERRKEQLDDLTDVKKQASLSGFYRHMLEQRTGGTMQFDSPAPDIVKKEIKTEPMDSGEAATTTEMQPETEPATTGRREDANNSAISASTSANIAPCNPAQPTAKLARLAKKPTGGAKSGANKKYRGRNQRMSSGSEEEAKEADTGKSKPGHTIYSSSSEDEVVRPPTPEPPAGLRFIKQPAVPGGQRACSPDSDSKRRSRSVSSGSASLSPDSDRSMEDPDPKRARKTKPKERKGKQSKQNDASTDDEDETVEVEEPTLFGRTETDEERLAKLRTLYARRHTEEDLVAYRERYFKRLAERGAIASISVN